MGQLTVGQLAEKANVNREIFRCYERMGLLPKPSWYKSGHRIYPLDSFKRAEFIKMDVDLCCNDDNLN